MSSVIRQQRESAADQVLDNISGDEQLFELLDDTTQAKLHDEFARIHLDPDDVQACVFAAVGIDSNRVHKSIRQQWRDFLDLRNIGERYADEIRRNAVE